VLDSFLALAVLILVVGVIAWALLGRGQPAGGKKAAPGRYQRASPWRKRAPILLLLGALVFLGLAFTQFRLFREAGSSGTVILTMDVSESMGRTDVDPSRLEAAKEAARVFLDGLPADLKVGLVTFANEATVLVEPTADRVEVLGALQALPRGEGTVIGDGLQASVDTLEAEWATNGITPGVIVLLSDGRDTGSVMAPLDAAENAKEDDVTVHTVVLGQALQTAGGGANVELLAQIAAATGGSALTADTATGLNEVYAGLQSQISTELGVSDYGALFVGFAALFAIAATVAVLVGLRSAY
jgi:Ca-activated chloride channel family protein